VAKSSQYAAPITGTERVLSSGRVVVPGEYFQLDDEELNDDHTKRLLDEGQILEVASTQKGGGEK
jgi:hypothetical protein